jgi:hypothetical protein
MFTTALILALQTQPDVTFSSLLNEMTTRTSLASYPTSNYQSLQASSYNRESTHRDAPGWFADSDGIGFIRQDGDEWVLMEHNGPGVITRIWTPFFYYNFNERTGPNVRIYLDGNPEPVIDEPLINLVKGDGTIPAPWADFTARAGDLYLPIPFGLSAKVTMVQKPFYNIINYRGYPQGTKVETFNQDTMARNQRMLSVAQRRLTPTISEPHRKTVKISAGGSTRLTLPAGSRYIDRLAISLTGAEEDPSILRSTVLSGSFDGRETIWCPVGDFFTVADEMRETATWRRQVNNKGLMSSQWVMPYRQRAELKITNTSDKEIEVSWGAHTRTWNWDATSMHFYARWRPDDIVPGTPFLDWNFIDIEGTGVYVADTWTVLNIRENSWWGEGDEKIYVDDAWESGFPTHFGTGTEDYYGWAGGVVPTLEDDFSLPFLSNKVGGVDEATQGYNICTRTRGLDAIPFTSRLRFDIEASMGTDMRNAWNLLGYSSTVFFYALPGATHNRPADLEAAAKPLMNMEQLQQMSDELKGDGS